MRLSLMRHGLGNKKTGRLHCRGRPVSDSCHLEILLSGEAEQWPPDVAILAPAILV